MSVARILVVGSGGREHALAWRLARDPGTPEVLVAPGNEGIARTFRCLAIPATDGPGLLAAARREGVELVVVGPEAPLAAGLADLLEAGGMPTLGPSAAAARLESSKTFAKQIMREAGIPTARAEPHLELSRAIAALARFAPPYVIKADGLAAGKGVCVTRDRSEAEEFLAACLEGGRFGTSGTRVLIEEFLEGEEASVMAVCDGERFVLLPAARDYKRAHDGDRGPNTGGMGALAPTPRVDESLEADVGERIVRPLLRRMAAGGSAFRGVLYCGLMLGENGPRVVEFNVRMGDPEAEVVLPLVDGDLSGLMAGAARGALEPSSLRRGTGAAVAVALVQKDYPGTAGADGMIEHLDAVADHPGVSVFHAGMSWEAPHWRTSGGRAAFVMARADDLAGARACVYRSIESLGGSGWRCRHDIGAGVGSGRAGACGKANQGGGVR